MAPQAVRLFGFLLIPWPVALAAQTLGVDQCARSGEVVIAASLRELPLRIEVVDGATLPADALGSPTGAWRYASDLGVANAKPALHPSLLVQAREGGPLLRLVALAMPHSRPISPEWLARDLVCLLASYNPAATAAWVVDLRHRKVLAAGSLQTIRH